MNLKIAANIVALGMIAFTLDYASPPKVIEQLSVVSTGVVIPWGDLSAKLVEAGGVDETKFRELSQLQGNIVMNEGNAHVMLNGLWAFGLANKNDILEHGPMMDRKYGGAGNFASTGGWTLAQGSAMDHYSMHKMITLTPEQQKKVENTSKNIFRPCCKNSTYFPDCNHGMAMLGLLELLAKQGATEEELYQVAEKANTLWFPPKPTGGC